MRAAPVCAQGHTRHTIRRIAARKGIPMCPKQTSPESGGRTRRPLEYKDRLAIEVGVNRGDRIATIARTIGRTPAVVAEEIKRNWTDDPRGMLVVKSRNLCIRQRDCSKRDLCEKGCLVPCNRCKAWMCNELCDDFEAEMCPRHKTSPYCCNNCPERLGGSCRHPYRFYEAKFADDMAKFRRSDSRKGIDCDPDAFKAAIEEIGRGLGKGQSPAHIIATSDKVPFSVSTFYRLVSHGDARDIIKMDPPRAVRYRPRSKSKGPGDGCIPREYLKGRTYEDFRNLDEGLKLKAVEMDTVVGRLGVDSQCILTLHFKRLHFQLYILLPRRDSHSVVRTLDMLDGVTEGLFGKLFPVMLADRGTEFSDVPRMESGEDGTPRTRVFFCDAMQSQQKGSAEKNHVELRRVLPKGKTDFDALTEKDMATCMSHINSYCRESIEWWSPIDVARVVLPLELTEALGIEKVERRDVNLTPYLVPHAMLAK